MCSAGVQGTLHRISAMRNRKGTIVGLTCRVGRAVTGHIDMIRDLLDGAMHTALLDESACQAVSVIMYHLLCISFVSCSGWFMQSLKHSCCPCSTDRARTKLLCFGRASGSPACCHASFQACAVPNSVLFLGRPGVGKTTVVREMARVLADDLHKRVVIVDTSNEIGGDGDVRPPAPSYTSLFHLAGITCADCSGTSESGLLPQVPHPAIGGARRMQVPDPSQQHRVMVSNSFPSSVATEHHCPECW